jgi:diphthamide synthase (EF-2-diphthine--ammonia ligase)
MKKVVSISGGKTSAYLAAICRKRGGAKGLLERKYILQKNSKSKLYT